MKKLIQVLLLTLSLTLLTGCSVQKAYEINLQLLQNSSGEYQFHNFEWNISPSEAEALLGISLQSLGTVGSHEVFSAQDACKWKNVTGEFNSEFENGKLDCISILLKPEAGVQSSFWDDIKNELFTNYGSVDADVRTSTSEELQLTTESETYLWEATRNRRTALTLTRLITNGEFKYIKLSVYIIPEEKTQ